MAQTLKVHIRVVNCLLFTWFADIGFDGFKNIFDATVVCKVVTHTSKANEAPLRNLHVDKAHVTGSCYVVSDVVYHAVKHVAEGVVAIALICDSARLVVEINHVLHVAFVKLYQFSSLKVKQVVKKG